MIYLLTFLLCLIADKLQARHRTCYLLIIIWLYAFLCFGYMTGSDWRAYELMYNEENLTRFINKGEFGFVWLIDFFKFFIEDFWIFNACMKMFFLYALVTFFGFFTNNKYAALGLSFCFHTLFLVIDCPMRFMIGVSFVILSVKFLLQKRWLIFILFSLFAVLFHLTSLIVSMVLILCYLSRSYVLKMSEIILWCAFILCLAISNSPKILEGIFSIANSVPLFEYYTTWYSIENSSDLTLISILKTAFIGTIIIANKEKIINWKCGDYIFSTAFFSLTIGGLFSLIPTGFRLNIVPKYFQVIAILELFFTVVYKYKITPKLLMKYVLLLLFAVLLMREVKSPKYTPYSNSIYYILTKHLPYTYRYNHNYIPEKDVVL